MKSAESAEIMRLITGQYKQELVMKLKQGFLDALNATMFGEVTVKPFLTILLYISFI